MLLDSYAWIEFFQGSKEGKKVEEILEKKDCFTSIVSISEITEWCLKNDLEPEIFVDILKKLSVIINLDEEIAKIAGDINFENKEIAENLYPNRSKLRGITRFSETRFLIPNWTDASIGVLNPVRNKKTIKNWGMLDALIYASACYYNLVTLTGDKHFEDLENVEML